MTTSNAVPQLWPGGTVVCIAPGPSLVQADVDACRERAYVVAVKDGWRLCRDADVLYACDARWWRRYYATQPPFAGQRYSLEDLAAPWATVLRNTGVTGLELDPGGLRTGQNSGYQAVNLAAHLVGPGGRIVLLGYDMTPGPDGQDHFFGAHPWRPQLPREWYVTFRDHYATLVAPLAAAGISIVNATRRTSLTCFPQLPLAEALPEFPLPRREVVA